MKNAKTTNGKWLETIHHFRKDNKIVRSVYLNRNLINEEFEYGTILIQTENKVIQIGECVYHDEDGLFRTYDMIMDMVSNDIDWDEISKYETVQTKIVKIKGAE